MPGAVALALGEGLAARAIQIGQADRKDEHGADDAQNGRRPGGRAEKTRRDDVLDLRRSGQAVHREGRPAQDDRRGQQALGNVGAPEHRGGEGIGREDHDEQGNPAIGEQGANRDDGGYRAARPHQLQDAGHQAVGKARDLEQFSKDRPQQEDGEIVLQEPRQPFHEQAGKERGDERRIGRQHGQQGGDRREQYDAVAPIGRHDQQPERRERDQDGDHRRVPLGLRRRARLAAGRAHALGARSWLILCSALSSLLAPE